MNPRSNRSVLLAGALAILVAVAVSIFLITGSSGDASRPAGAGAAAHDDAAQLATSSGPAVATIGDGGDRAAQAVAAAGAFPEAYERALSGIVGRIVETEGAPVKGAPVELIGGLFDFFTFDVDRLLFDPDAFELKLTEGKTTTDADGRFRFEHVDPRGYYLVGVNLGRGRPQVRFVDRTPMVGETTDLGDIRLDPIRNLTGRIVDERGRGVAGVRVRTTNLPAFIYQAGVANVEPGIGLLVRMGPRNAPKLVWRLPRWTDAIFEKLPFPSTTTRDDGTFRIEGAPAGALTIVVQGAGIPSAHHGPIPPANAAEKDLGEIAISRGEDVEGEVLDEKGVAVGGAEVMVGIPSPLAKNEVAFLRKPFKTGGDGKFTAHGIPGSSLVLVARAPDVVEWSFSDLIELTGDPVSIKVPAPRSMVVRAQDQAGKPLDATVTVQRAIEGLSLFPQVEPTLNPRVDRLEPGAFRLRGLKEGAYNVYARANGYAIAKAEAKIEAAGEPEVTIKLDPELRVRALVLGKENGKPAPLEAATVFGAPNKGMERLGFMGLGSAKTNAEGVALVRALGTGRYYLIASHPAYAPGRAEIELPGTTSGTIQLVVGGTIEGRVHRAGVVPEKPVMIAVAAEDEKMAQLPRTSVSGLEGTFRFTHLAPGKYTVVATPRVFDESLTALNPMAFMRFASDNASTPCDVADEQTTTLDLDLATGGRQPKPDDGRIRGSAIVNGVAAEGDYASASGPEWVRPVLVDASGAFDLGRVKPGDYTVALSRGSMRTGPFGSSVVSRLVSVKALDEAFVDFNVQTGRVIGIVRDEAGKPFPQARLRMRSAGAKDEWGPGVSRALSEDDGTFAIDDVAAGKYRITASAPEFADASATVDVPARGDSSKVEIRLGGGVKIEGTVEADLPAKARFVNLSFRFVDPADPKAPGTATNARLELEKRTFSAKGMRVGAYKVSLQAFGGGDGRRSFKDLDLDVPPGGLANVTLRFEAAPAGTEPQLPMAPRR